MPEGRDADELTYSTRQIAVATAWSALMLGLCLGSASFSALKNLEVAALW